MKKIIIVLSDGFEEIEAITAADVLSRAGFKVVLAGLESSGMVRGSHGIGINAETAFSEIKSEECDALVLPGGMPGALNLYNSAALVRLAVAVAARGGVVAAICAAPIVLAKAGLLKSGCFTMYPGFEQYLGSLFSNGEETAIEGNIITGRGPGASFAFASAVCRSLGYDTSALYDGMFVRS